MGCAFISLSPVPFHLYKAELTSEKRGSSRFAPRLLAGSTPRHASEAPAPPRASSPRPGEQRGRGPGRGAPDSAGGRAAQARAPKASSGATRRALRRFGTSPPGFPMPRSPRPAHPPDSLAPGPPGAPARQPGPAALTEQQQLDLARRLLAILAEVPVDHLTPLHRRLVLGAQRTAHCARSKSWPPLPSSPPRCLETQVNSFFLDAGVRIPPDAGHATPTHFRNGPREALSAEKLAAPRGSCLRPGSAPRLPPRLASLRGPEVSGFQALGTATGGLLLVAAPQPLEARHCSASARRRGPAPARPSRRPATTPRARARARALGHHPLGRVRAPTLPRTPAPHSPRGPATARALGERPRKAERCGELPYLASSAGA